MKYNKKIIFLKLIHIELAKSSVMKVIPMNWGGKKTFNLYFWLVLVFFYIKQFSWQGRIHDHESRIVPFQLIVTDKQINIGQTDNFAFLWLYGHFLQTDIKKYLYTDQSLLLYIYFWCDIMRELTHWRKFFSTTQWYSVHFWRCPRSSIRGYVHPPFRLVHRLVDRLVCPLVG